MELYLCIGQLSYQSVDCQLAIPTYNRNQITCCAYVLGYAAVGYFSRWALTGALLHSLADSSRLDHVGKIKKVEVIVALSFASVRERECMVGRQRRGSRIVDVFVYM